MLKSGTKRSFWLTAGAVFLAIALINYLPILRGQVPFPRDLVMQHAAWDGLPRSSPRQQVAQLIDVVALFYPFRALTSHSASAGTLPLWNPYIMSGAPFEANAQSALFSPLTILFYIFPLKAAWAISLVMRIFLAGLFMTLFVDAIGGSRVGSIVSGIVFALCGFNIQWQGMSNGDSGIWLPLICYSIVRLHRKLDGRSVAIAAFAFATPVLAGHPETAVHCTLAALALTLFLSISSFDWRFLALFAAAGVLSVGLAAVQVIPTMEWVGLLGPQLDNPQPVLDRHQGQGFFSRDIFRDPNSAGIAIPEGSAYVGMLGLLAAALAFFHKSRPYATFLFLMTIVAAAVAFGFQPVRWLVVHLPVIKALKNGRLILIADFAIAAMAGLGISWLELESEFETAHKRKLLFTASAAVILCLGIYELHRATLTPVDFSRSPLASLFLLLAAMAVISARLLGYLNNRVFPAAVCGLCAFEMLTFSYGYLGFTRAEEVFPAAPVLEYLRTRIDLKQYRVAKERVPIPHDAGMIYGFEAADGYDLTTERARMFTADLTEDRQDGVMFLAEKILGSADRRLDMLNVKYLLVRTPSPELESLLQSDRFAPIHSQGSVAVLENKSVLPRIYLVPASGIEIVPQVSQLARVKQTSFDPQRSVLFSQPPGFPSVSDHGEIVQPRIETVNRSVNATTFKVESNEPSVVVISQMFYPGWKATINGTTAPVYPIDYALTGIVVPSGKLDVRLFFRPETFVAGVILSLLSGIAIILLVRSAIL
jgi:hypothetical protein